MKLILQPVWIIVVETLYFYMKIDWVAFTKVTFCFISLASFFSSRQKTLLQCLTFLQDDF